MTGGPGDSDNRRGWERLGLFLRVALVGLSAVAVAGLVGAAVLGQAWPVLIGAPAALLAGMIARYAFASTDIDD